MSENKEFCAYASGNLGWDAVFNTLRMGLFNCLNARSPGLNSE